MIIHKNKVYLLVKPNPVRQYLAIQCLDATAVCAIAKSEEEYEYFEQNAFWVRKGRRLVIEGVDCYKGGLYVATDIDATDVRVLEL